MQKEIKVDFVIEWNRSNGKVNASTLKKVAKHLIESGLLRKGTEYFIEDINGSTTFWSVEDGANWYSDYGYALTIEFTEDETEKGCDWFNCLYFDKRGAKITDSKYESYKVN